jgi:hypothetical protein
MSTQGAPDRIYSALNPLVMDGTLTPHQADRVYQAVGRETTGSPAAGTGGSGGVGVTGNRLDRPPLLAAVSVLSAGLLAMAYFVGAVIDESNDIGWKSVILMLGTALVVAAAAGAWFVLLRGSAWSGWVSGVLGALGFGALAFSLVVMWDSDAAVYLSGILMLVGGAAGFWFLKGQLYTLVAVFGGVLVLGQIFDDVLSDSGDEGDILSVGIAFLFYGLAVGAAGWFLGARRLLGMVGLSIAGASMFFVIVINAFAVSLASLTSSLDGTEGGGSTPGDVRSDIRVALVLGLVVVVLAALAHAFDGYNGFAVLTFIGATVLPITAIYAWSTDHPARWATGFAVIGALGLAAVVGLQLDRRTPAPPHGYAGQPMGPDHGTDPHSDTISR